MKVTQLIHAENYEPQPNWRRASLCDEPALSIEHFVKPAGHASPMHEHSQEQVTVVIKGCMKAIAGDGTTTVLEVGDAAFFAGNEPHQIVNLLDEPSMGLDIFCPGRPFDFWLRRK